MARVLIDPTTMTVQMEGLHQLWGFKRRITAPLAHVRGATVEPGVVSEPKGLRAPGLGLGRVATIGTFYRDDQRHFWDVTAGGRPIVVELEGERYDRLVVEVDDPHATVDAIDAAATSARRRG